MPYSWLLLIRHGRTRANELGTYAGRSDVPLDEVGRKQVEALARRLTGLPLAAIHSSPVLRAMQTAEALQAGRSLQIQREDELAELRMDAWEGLTPAEISERYPVEWHTWLRSPATLESTHIESLGSAAQRCRKLLSRIGPKYPRQAVALVTHEAIARLMILSTLRLDLRNYRSFRVAPGSLSVMAWKPDHGQLSLLSDCSHHDGASLPFLGLPEAEAER